MFDFCFTASRLALELMKSHIYGYEGSFQKLRCLRLKCVHSSSANVMGTLSYTPTHLYVVTQWCLIKHRDHCVFIFYLPETEIGLPRGIAVLLFSQQTYVALCCCFVTLENSRLLIYRNSVLLYVTASPANIKISQ